MLDIPVERHAPVHLTPVARLRRWEPEHRHALTVECNDGVGLPHPAGVRVPGFDECVEPLDNPTGQGGILPIEMINDASHIVRSEVSAEFDEAGQGPGLARKRTGHGSCPEHHILAVDRGITPTTACHHIHQLVKMVERDTTMQQHRSHPCHPAGLGKRWQFEYVQSPPKLPCGGLHRRLASPGERGDLGIEGPLLESQHSRRSQAGDEERREASSHVGSTVVPKKPPEVLDGRLQLVVIDVEFDDQ